MECGFFGEVLEVFYRGRIERYREFIYIVFFVGLFGKIIIVYILGGVVF
jgi:hypothetical protein